MLDQVISSADVLTAAERLRGVARRTPTLTSEALDERLGATVFFKAENLQRTGSFKFRGAYNKIARLTDDQRAAGLLASSSGNHAQAVALAARLCDSSATILMPLDAPASKVEATRRIGAEIISFDRYQDDPDDLTAELAAARGLTLVHPYDDADVIAGAGTTALELFEDAGELDLLLVCTGGGGLMSGCAVTLADLSPTTRIIGVEPDTSDDWHRSFLAGERIRIELREGIADGQQLTRPGELTFAISRRLVDGIRTVTDAEIRCAMATVFESLHVVTEPSGASALAAALAGKIDVTGLRVGVTLSGGNLDVARFASVMAGR